MTNQFSPSVDAFLMISAQEIMDWTNQSLATMGSNLPSVNLKETDKKLKLKWLFLV
jgi:HSP20 family protein